MSSQKECARANLRATFTYDVHRGGFVKINQNLTRKRSTTRDDPTGENKEIEISSLRPRCLLKIISFTVALNKAPGKILDDFSAGDAPPATDSRPSLPSITGFDDWDSDKFDLTKFDESKPNGSKTDEVKNPTLAGQILSLQLATTLNFKRRSTTIDEPNEKAKIVDDSLEMTLVAAKEDLTPRIPTFKIAKCNSTDLIGCFSAGALDVPHFLGIPMFPWTEATLSRNKKEAKVDGF
ncbi:hypothetical protein MMC29_002343 [Sticta canariensis]|nr:hypothetical protein [Sticta canariensis]